MKYKLRAFFSGRNGIDGLGKVLLWVSLIVMLLSTLFGITFLYGAALALLCYVYIRAFSRNVEKCLKLRFRQRKTHKFYRCPQCRQQLRVPKGKGRICITCRSCGAHFERKT